MQAILKHCTAVLGRFIFIGFSVQIVLGILWMCNAFAGFNGPGEGIVCVGAVLLFGGVVWFAKGGLCQNSKRWKDLFAVLAVLTFPFVMQCMVKPDVRLLVAAVLLFYLGYLGRCFDRWKEGKGKEKIVLFMGLVLMTGGLTVGTDVLQNGWTPISTRLTERMVWTTLYDTYAGLPQELRESVDYHKMVESTYEATGMREQFVPSLIEELGEEQAAEMLGQFRVTAWQLNKKQILKEIFWDAAGYSVSPVVVELQLAGRAYDSYTGMNYRELLLPAPKLGKLYTDYSCWWFGIALVAVAFAHVLRFWGEKALNEKKALIGKKASMEKKRYVLGKWLVAATVCMGMVAYYALDGAGRMDYKNTLLVLCIWLLWMAGGVRDAKD